MFRKSRLRMEAEIQQLEKELHHELPREIQRAREMGDLRENAEYQAALERQGLIQARLAQLRKMVSELAAIPVDQFPRDRVALGSRVRLVDLDSGETVTYELVLSEEADFSRGRVSVNSPIGRGLLGHRKGDEVEIRAPSGSRSFEMEELQTVHDRKNDA